MRNIDNILHTYIYIYIIITQYHNINPIAHVILMFLINTIPVYNYIEIKSLINNHSLLKETSNTDKPL